jgi:nucleoside-triphosphate--adenylate kinase
MLCTACRVSSSRSFPVAGHHRCQNRRSLAQTASHRRAIPFSLNPYNRPQDDRDERVMRMLMFGKPGAGKGTLTARLAQKYDILTLSTGDLLRQHIADQTEAEAIIARGGLLPDDTVLKVVTSKLDALQNKVMSNVLLKKVCL